MIRDPSRPGDGFDPTVTGADVVNLDHARRNRRPESDPKDFGTHFSVDLDESPALGGIPVEPPTGSAGPGRRPIIPSHLSTLANLKTTIRNGLGLLAHHAGYHAVRLPWYALQAAFWATIGVCRLANGILRGASDATPTVRTYLADREDAEKILIAARGLRPEPDGHVGCPSPRR